MGVWQGHVIQGYLQPPGGGGGVGDMEACTSRRLPE